MHNPLKRPILEILKESSKPLKEYDLHTILGGAAFAEFIDNCSLDLSLFRKHFLVMNALYELHDELLSEGIHLHISALAIYLEEVVQTIPEEKALSTDTGFQKLSEYYQDWQHFNKTNDNDVSNLLQQFWKKFLANEEKAQSLNCLELEESANWPEIQQKYKQLCQLHHPDKGGDSLYFLEIRQAYDNLKCIFN
ncbi:MAG: molecular chaperone DnaJ [Gammaproteobacteria bacterium]|nr:molecular chaperone DnaJ [Gammaproteobacteria bacterium]